MKYWLYHYTDRYVGFLIELFFLFFDRVNKIFKKHLCYKIDNILVIKLAMMGDTILLYPAIRALKEKYSQAKLTILCSRINLDIVKMWNFVDEIIIFEFDRVFKQPWIVLFQLFNLWRRKFDLGVDFEQWFRITPIILFLSSKYKVGFRTPKQLRHYLFDKWVWHIKNKHEVECFCDVVKSLGVEVKDKSLFLKIDDHAKRKIREILFSNNISEKKFAIIHPGCGIHGYYRQWNIERYAEVAEYISSNYNLKVVITGSKDDLNTIQKFKKFYTAGLDLSGKTSIEELIALVSMAKFVICGNTGVLHIAAALGIPTVAIHGPTNPIKWGPWGKGHIIIKSDLDCSPCSYLGFEYRCKERRCLEIISTEEIKRAVNVICSHN